MFSFLEGLQCCDFSLRAHTPRLREHSLMLKKERSGLYPRKFTFSQRVVNMWNDLPLNVVTAPTVKAFKNLIEAHPKNMR